MVNNIEKSTEEIENKEKNNKFEEKKIIKKVKLYAGWYIMISRSVGGYNANREYNGFLTDGKYNPVEEDW